MIASTVPVPVAVPLQAVVATDSSVSPGSTTTPGISQNEKQANRPAALLPRAFEPAAATTSSKPPTSFTLSTEPTAQSHDDLQDAGATTSDTPAQTLTTAGKSTAAGRRETAADTTTADAGKSAAADAEAQHTYRFAVDRTSANSSQTPVNVPDGRQIAAPSLRPELQTKDAATARPAFSAPAAVVVDSAEAVKRAAAAFGQNAGARDQGLPSQSSDRGSLMAARTVHTIQTSGFQIEANSIPGESAVESRPAPAIPNEDGVAASIVQSMRLQWQNGTGTAVVQLDPDYLGPVTISLHVDQGNVTATLHAANAEVRGWIEANEASLRQGLADQGLTLERLVVSDEAPRGRHEPQQDAQQRQPDREQAERNRRRDDTSTFEIVV